MTRAAAPVPIELHRLADDGCPHAEIIRVISVRMPAPPLGGVFDPWPCARCGKVNPPELIVCDCASPHGGEA